MTASGGADTHKFVHESTSWEAVVRCGIRFRILGPQPEAPLNLLVSFRASSVLHPPPPPPCPLSSLPLFKSSWPHQDARFHENYRRSIFYKSMEKQNRRAWRNSHAIIFRRLLPYFYCLSWNIVSIFHKDISDMTRSKLYTFTISKCRFFYLSEL